MTRTASLERSTGETRVAIKINLDGTRKINARTGVGFFDHMLHLLAFHAGWDLDVTADGDTHVDSHHTVEDVGIVLGKVFSQAAVNTAGIARYGSSYVPLNESLGRAVTDLCGRPHLEYVASYPNPNCGDFPVELVEEFFRSFVASTGLTIHLDLIRCRNSHHGAEVLFKACGRALAQTLTVSGTEVLSTKGSLDH